MGGRGLPQRARQQEFTLGNIPDLVPNAPVRVTTVPGGQLGRGQLLFSSRSTALRWAPSTSMRRCPAYDFAAIATTSTAHQPTGPEQPRHQLRVGLTYSSGDANASGYLDYLEINAQRQLRLSGAQLEFRSLANIAPQARNRYVVANATGAPWCGT